MSHRMIARQSLPLTKEEHDKSILIQSELSPGLYNLTIDADGRRFDWESLYLNLNEFDNVNQRTGPWDFNFLNNNRPVLPAYWVWLNDRRLGLMYFNRPSADHVTNKWFRGEVGFRVRQAGRYTLKFKPYHAFRITWQKTLLEQEPQGAWQPPAERDNVYARQILPQAMPQNRFTPWYLHSLQWAKTSSNAGRPAGGFELPILLAAWHWFADREALAIVEKSLDHWLSLPAWGNPREDGYAHNGDMGVAKLLFGLSVALRWLPKEWEHLRDRLAAKLTYQGDTFLEQTLLHRGYWGGALLQDHGFQSLTWFATAAYFCQGLIPSARDWLALAIPRTRRTLRALPRDGVVPCTSYHVFSHYADKLVIYRELHRQASGEDIFDNDCIRSLSAAARALHVPARPGMPTDPRDVYNDLPALAYPSPLGDLWPYEGAMGFLAQFPDDPDAVWLLNTALDPERMKKPRYPFYEGHFQKNMLWAMLLDKAPKKTAAAFSSPLIEVQGSTTWFKDSGVAALRAKDSLAVVKCGSPTSHTSYENTTHNHDNHCFAPLGGDFVFVHAGRRVLHHTDSRYKILTAHGNVLLVDGRGQWGDLGMPMSQPDAPYYGEKIIEISHAGRGVRMDITPAYDGLHHYFRELQVDEQGNFYLRDEVRADRPRQLTWLFHTGRVNCWQKIDEGKWELTVKDHRYKVEFGMQAIPVTARLQETPAVWSYPGNNSQVCHHLAIEPAGLVTEASLTFVLRI